jgi:hypothetical protein
MKQTKPLLLNLINPSGATLADNSGTGTILDDDPLPALSINDVSVFEGNSGTVNAIFTVTLSPCQWPDSERWIRHGE